MVEAEGVGHRYDDVHLVGHQVRADLVQVGLVGLGVGVVVGIVEGDAPLGPHLVQAGLQGGDDLVEGSVVHIVDDAHLVDGGALLGGSCAGGGGSRRRRGPAAGQSQGGAGGRQGSGLQKAAAGDHLSVFSWVKLLSCVGAAPSKKGPPRFCAERAIQQNDPSPCFTTRTGSKHSILRCHLVCPASAQSLSRGANTPLPCNGRHPS